MSFDIRPATEHDLEAILALDRETSTAPHWNMGHYAVLVEGPEPQRSGILGVAIQGGKIVGFIAGHRVLDEAELESIVVSSSNRRQGIARALVEWFIRVAEAATIHLEVRASNTAAISLYQSAKFTIKGQRFRYYENPPEDAVLMGRELSADGLFL